MPDLLKSEGLKAASEIAKQIIALCTGAVAFTVTFLEKFTQHPEKAPAHVPGSLYVSWVLFGFTIFFALWTLMAITGTLVSLDRQANGWPLDKRQQAAADGDGRHVQLPALLMLAAFLFAVIAMIAAGIRVA
jgi:hypothetical protein